MEKVSAFKNKKLSKEQIDLLEKINMSWNRFKDRWKVGFKYAEQYFIEHKDINVPIDYITSDGFPLGDWINQQRIKYRKGKLSCERINMLEKYNMVWNPLDALWNTGYKYAQEYYKDYGNLDIPYTYITEDGFKLGVWLYKQRTKYKKKN